MHLARPRVARTPALVRILAALLTATLAACSNGASGSPTPSGPGGSGAAGCTTAPAPASDLPGWNVSAQNPTLFPLIIAGVGEITCGPNRLLFSFLDKANKPVGAPDRSASVAIFNLGRDGDTPVATADGTFVWAIEDERGIYYANVDLPEAGLYGIEFTTALGAAEPEKIRLTFEAQASSPLVKVGQRAPATDNPTIQSAGGDVARVSTDEEPLPALYEHTVASALEAHEPFVVVFATPKFCATEQCGPTLERLKPLVPRYPGVTFINVEPYKLKFEDGALQADLDPATAGLVPVEATTQWGLRSEPWVFVVDRDGVVVGSFGLIFSEEEIAAALDGLE